MKKITKIIFIILFIFVYNKNDYKEPEISDPGYEQLLQWGLDNSLNITHKIRFIKDRDTRQYVAKIIPEKEVIIDIPAECMMNINKTLHLLNLKKFRRAYHQYIEEDKLSTEISQDEHYVEQAFMAYIL